MFVYFRFLTLALLMLVFAYNVNSQVKIDFENNSLSGWEQSPDNRWGVTPLNAISGNYSLHHEYDNATAGTDQISLELPNVPDFTDTIVWTFRLKYGYKPSSANNWAFFLMSDLASEYMFPKTITNALILGVNFSGSDDLLKIWQQRNGELVPVLTSTINWETKVSTSVALFVVTRFPDARWVVRFSSTGNSSDLEEIMSGEIDNTPNSRYCGLYYKYSSSQDRQLWFDDFQLQATFITDTVAPKADSCFLIGNRVLQISYNEAINFDKISKESFTFNGESRLVDSIAFMGNNIFLYLSAPLISGTKLELLVNGIEDVKGNVASEKQFSLFYYEPQAYDIVISEVMYDPDPLVNLPNAEYLEVYNRSVYPINLSSLKLGINSTFYSLASAFIQPNDYLILTSFNNINSFESYNKCIGVWNSTYALSNEGAYISLIDTFGNLISFVHYSGSWVDEKLKSDGGWSLEMIDVNYPCDDKVNWKVSANPNGGTPGVKNSVAAKNSDILAPRIESVRVLSDSSLQVYFSEPIDYSRSLRNYFFRVNKGVESPKLFVFEPEDFSAIRLTFTNKFKPSTIYSLTLSDSLRDCAGNKLNTNEITFALPEEADSFDVIISEVLFNAFPNGSDFVELYNRSNKTIDLGKMVLAVFETGSKEVNSFCSIAPDGNLFFPGSYVVITKHISELEAFYYIKNKDVIYESSSCPSFPDKMGEVALLSRKLQTIDWFSYNENMHVAFLSSKEGVSLERLSFERPTQMAGNWLSASQTSGFATPGYENSQKEEYSKSEDGNYIVEPEVFSPNMDGVDDVTSISINGLEKPATATIKIYNASGVLVRNLLNRSYIDSEFKINWDGASNQSRLLPAGIYIIHIVLIFNNGQTKEIKRTCVIGKR